MVWSNEKLDWTAYAIFCSQGTIITQITFEFDIYDSISLIFSYTFLFFFEYNSCLYVILDARMLQYIQVKTATILRPYLRTALKDRKLKERKKSKAQTRSLCLPLDNEEWEGEVKVARTWWTITTDRISGRRSLCCMMENIFGVSLLYTHGPLWLVGGMTSQCLWPIRTQD